MIAGQMVDAACVTEPESLWVVVSAGFGQGWAFGKVHSYYTPPGHEPLWYAVDLEGAEHLTGKATVHAGAVIASHTSEANAKDAVERAQATEKAMRERYAAAVSEQALANAKVCEVMAEMIEAAMAAAQPRESMN